MLTAVIFDDDLEAERVALAVKLLKRENGLAQIYEFKFNGSDARRKKLFFDTVKPGSFRIRSLVIDKTLVYKDELKRRKSLFYNYAVKLLLQDTESQLKDAKIRLDGQGDRAYKQAAQSYFKTELNARDNRRIKNIRFVDSRTDMLIQLADMASGAIYRSLDESRSDHDTYLKMIRPRIENIWHFR